MKMNRKQRAAQLITTALIGVGFVVAPAVAGPAIAESVPAVEATVPTAEAHTRASGQVWKCFPASTRYKGSGCGWYRYYRSADIDPSPYWHENIESWSRYAGWGPLYVSRELVHGI